MTWIEVIDTTIKIGLGAVIGGLFTLMVNKQTHKNQIEKEIMLDNRQTLKTVGAQFETIHIEVISLYQELLNIVSQYVKDINSDMNEYRLDPSRIPDKLRETDISMLSVSELVELLKLPEPPKIYNKKRESVDNIVKELYALQGILMLYGYKWMSSVIYEYTMNMGSVSPRKPFQDNIEDNIENLMPEVKVFEKFQTLRNIYYKVANIYMNNSVPSDRMIVSAIKLDLVKHDWS